MGAIQLVSIAASIAHGRINAELTARVVFDLKTSVFQAMQRLSLSFFTSKETGSLMTRVNSDATHLQYFFHDGFPYFIVNAINLIGIITVMLMMHWQLTLLVLLPTPLIVLCVTKAFPKLWNAFSRRWRHNSALNSLVNDALTGIRVVKAFGKEDTERERFMQRNTKVYQVNMQVGHIQAVLFPVMGLIMGAGRPIVLSIGGWQVISGEITIGTLMTFLSYLSMLYGPLEFMTHIVDWWSSCMNAAGRIFEILDATPDVAERKDPVRLPNLSGHIELNDVSFGYEPNKTVLENIALEIKPGEMLGVLGYSGAGKSTLVNLISRLYDVQEGCIKIDGVDVRDIAVADLRAQIGMVLQDTYLFAGTIMENVAYAKPGATIEEIIRACKVARAHDFIIKLPNGYDTLIGHRGQNLSGGERQRLAIARAILHNPRILILDEATASVDTETERGIQEGLESLVKGRTTIAIAHRLSTLRNADRLLVIDKGKVVETGTHEDLIKLQGHYFKMLEKQRNALKIRGVEVSEHQLAGRAG
jgi:ATP-binding cassette subfamily B protein